MAGDTVKQTNNGLKPAVDIIKQASPTSKPRRKRENDDSELLNKRHKPNSGGVYKCDTKLTDVIDDCLRPIFEYLNFKDLSCVAIAHSNFKEAAGFIFGRKYGKKEIRMTSDGITVHEDDNCMQSIFYGFSVKNPSKSSYYMEFLRILGDRMCKLSIGMNNDLYKSLEPILLDNCTESLVELSLYKPHFGGPSKLRDVFGNIKKSFPNVKKLSLNRCHLNERASQLNVWFPKLQNLTIFDCTFTSSQLVVTTYPSLKHFSVGGWKQEHTLKKSQVCKILRLNPQICSLDIGLAADGHELKFFRRINVILPQLERLNMSWEMISFKYHNDEAVNFKHLRQLQLDFGFHSFSGARVLPFAFDQLTELEINNIPVLTGLKFKLLIKLNKLSLFSK